MTDEAQDRTFTSEDELDLSGEGLQPTRCDLLITKAEMKEKKADGSQRWEVTMEPQGEVDLGGRKEVKDSGYYLHPESVGKETDLQRIGRGALKRLGKIVLGTDQFSLQALVGLTVNAEVKETDDGFLRVGKYRAVETVEA